MTRSKPCGRLPSTRCCWAACGCARRTAQCATAGWPKWRPWAAPVCASPPMSTTSGCSAAWTCRPACAVAAPWPNLACCNAPTAIGWCCPWPSACVPTPWRAWCKRKTAARCTPCTWATKPPRPAPLAWWRWMSRSMTNPRWPAPCATVCRCGWTCAMCHGPMWAIAPWALRLGPATTTTTTVALTLPANVDQAWREEVLLLTNNERFKEGLNPLVGCDNLHRAAQTHSDAMHEQGFFEHDNPYTGDGVGERANRAGYEWASIGENIAMGQESPKAVVRAWMNSPGHRENILSDFKHLGVGITRGDSDINRKSSRIWWVQNFGFGGPCS